ncbi:hypothetical protein LOAG_12824 [Loa loa]|uniref:Uncharacterized protein n=1 Tax=Loa loa TaxID=7209 RepID=A0A1S0TLL7_LOALO|nr:hypothetical protein LOAG_12824 [Loa loa]EFO15686.1 hypothetical protein LOAG_12824 [Loa loa]
MDGWMDKQMRKMLFESKERIKIIMKGKWLIEAVRSLRCDIRVTSSQAVKWLEIYYSCNKMTGKKGMQEKGIVHWSDGSRDAVAIATHRTGCPAAGSSKRANDSGTGEVLVAAIVLVLWW